MALREIIKLPDKRLRLKSEPVKRIDALFDIERGINGQSTEQRLRVRQEQSAPLVVALEAWLREQRSRLSSASSVAAPIDYMLRRWDRFTRFLDDGRICLTNNAAERALRGFALGRKSWLRVLLPIRQSPYKSS